MALDDKAKADILKQFGSSVGEEIISQVEANGSGLKVVRDALGVAFKDMTEVTDPTSPAKPDGAALAVLAELSAQIGELITMVQGSEAAGKSREKAIKDAETKLDARLAAVEKALAVPAQPASSSTKTIVTDGDGVDTAALAKMVADLKAKQAGAANNPFASAFPDLTK